MPGLYIIMDSNGAGKSSFGAAFLPPAIREAFEVFDGDRLFLQKRKELYPQQIKSLKESKQAAGEWLIQHFKLTVQKVLDSKTSFVYEGHFVAEETWDVPRRFLTAGYKLFIVFLGLEDTSLSELRVLDRAVHGGHNVSPAEIEINFFGNLHKLNEHFHLADELTIIDTSTAHPKPLAKFEKGNLVSSISIEGLPDWFVRGLPVLYAAVQEKKDL